MNNLHIKTIGGRLLMAVVGALCLVGCDFYSVVGGSPVKYRTENGKMFVMATYFPGAPYYIHFNLKGEYTIQPDSFRFHVHPYGLKAKNIGAVIPEYKRHRYSEIELKGDTTITDIAAVKVGLQFDINLGWLSDGSDTCYVAVLPCDFIMCNGKRVITDTIRFKFTEHPEYKGLSGQFKYHKQFDKEFNADD